MAYGRHPAKLGEAQDLACWPRGGYCNLRSWGGQPKSRTRQSARVGSVTILVHIRQSTIRQPEEGAPLSASSVQRPLRSKSSAWGTLAASVTQASQRTLPSPFA